MTSVVPPAGKPTSMRAVPLPAALTADGTKRVAPAAAETVNRRRRVSMAGDHIRGGRSATQAQAAHAQLVCRDHRTCVGWNE